MKALRSYLVLVLSSLFVLMSCKVSADTSRSLEYKVKAAYLYNFAKFIDWPKDVLNGSGKQTINYCIYGNDPFGHTIGLIKNKTVKGHRVQVRYIKRGGDFGACHVLYLSEINPQVLQIIASLKHSPILTVSDANQFAADGGCIGLTISAGKVRFNINAQAIKQAGLKVSAKLMELAEVVIK